MNKKELNWKLQNKISGYFITFEGIEGVGKSSAINFSKDYLSQKGINCVVTREYGGTEVAEEIRKILLQKKYEKEKMCIETEILLSFASRAQHLKNLIIPNLKKSIWVLSDRFTDSTYAYQGYGRNFSLRRISIIEKWVQNSFKPMYTFLLDIDVKLAFERMLGRRKLFDRIEEESAIFFNRVRAGYLKLAKKEPNRFIIISANQSKEKVFEEIANKIDEILKK